MCDLKTFLLDGLGTRVGVVYKNRDWADEWLKEFEDQIGELAILRVMINGYDRFMVEMRNGAIIQSVNIAKVERGARLRRYDRLIVESCLENDKVMDSLIKEYSS